MKRTATPKRNSQKLLSVVYGLAGLLGCALLILLLIWLLVPRGAETPSLLKGPDYVADAKTLWSVEPIPDANAYLTEQANGLVRKASYVAAPKAEVGTQPIAIQLEMTDGTLRVENATLTIQESVLQWEKGTDATAAAILGENYADAIFSEAPTDFDTLGSFDISVTMASGTYPFTLMITDTLPPQAEPKNPCRFYVNQPITCEDFFASCEDASAVTMTFVTEPDVSSLGDRTVQILLTDEADNQTTVEVAYSVVGDAEPPVITGAVDLVTLKGVEISYLHGVTAKDTNDGAVAVKLQDDMTPAQYDEGEHTLTYVATDAAGNTAEVPVTLTVLPFDTDVTTLTDDTIYRMGYAITGQILTEDLDERERAWKLYRYVQDHMFYKDNKDVLDWKYAAAVAIQRGYGDCRNYYGFAWLLLECAGVENMLVEHIPPTENSAKHFWNLVKVDGEWYHFDTTPRVGRSDFFLLTDAEMDAYSARNGNCFKRDTSLYPATP